MVWLQMACTKTGSCFGERKTVGVFLENICISVGFHDDNETKGHWRERRWRGEGIVEGGRMGTAKAHDSFLKGSRGGNK